MNYGIKVKDKTLIEQMAGIRRSYPTFTTEIQSDALYIKGGLQPTSRSDVYQAAIVYHYRQQPEINILHPILERNFKGDAIPHMYTGDKLCLHRPTYFEFRFTHLISATIIPWISLWLYYYETWHITGDWLGGGEHAENK